MARKILIIGVSSEDSVGFRVGEHLRAEGNEVVYASRSGRIGEKCDITDAASVAELLAREKPSVVIHTAGVFSPSQPLGSVETWDAIKDHILARAFGMFAILDAAVRSKVRVVIALAGREISAAPGMGMYTVGNGALWALVRFSAQHAPLSVYYIDMPFIAHSTMEKKYIEASHISEEDWKSVAAPIEEVNKAVAEALAGKYKSGERIIVHPRSAL